MADLPRALIIAPEANMASLVGAMLRSLGRWEIVELTDATQAHGILARRPFDLLILDDATRRPDALDIVRKLRAEAANPSREAPVIMMASAPDATRIAEARDAGVSEFLRKPFAAAHLKARLDGLAAQPRAFVEAADFKGPDRRRRNAAGDTPQRRAADGDPA